MKCWGIKREKMGGTPQKTLRPQQSLCGSVQHPMKIVSDFQIQWSLRMVANMSEQEGWSDTETEAWDKITADAS